MAFNIQFKRDLNAQRYCWSHPGKVRMFTDILGGRAEMIIEDDHGTMISIRGSTLAFVLEEVIGSFSDHGYTNLNAEVFRGIVQKRNDRKG